MEENKQIYELNLSCLKNNHPAIFRLVQDPQTEQTGELIPIKGGNKNLKVIDEDGNQYFMHGQSGPFEDAMQFLEMIPPKASGVIAMMGFGLGLPCLEILKNRPQLRHFFIFELDPGIFKQALFAYDLSALFDDHRVTICLDKEPNLNAVFVSAFKALELEDIQILKHGPSFKINSNYISFTDKIFSYLNSFSISGATTKVMGEKFLRNRFRNLKRIRNDILIDSIKGIFKNIPAVLVAGGPSLDKNIAQLENTKGKAILFAVDSVVPSLLKKGIVPNFITSIDPQKITFEKFKGAKLRPDGVSLICSAWVSSRVPFHLPAERVIWTFGGKNIEVWMNNVLGGNNSYIGAGTVAHLNLHTALTMGCEPIIFVGQDLAYSETKDHAQNVSLNNNTQMKTFLNSKEDWKWVKGINGGQVKTSRSFFNNKDVFEGIIKKNPSVKFINATEGGAHIEGTEVMKLKEVLENIPFTDIDANKEVVLHAIPLGDSTVDALDRQLNDLVNMGRGILKIIKASNTISLELKKTIKELKKKSKKIEQFSALPQKVQNKIKKMDSLNATLDEQGIFWHILDEVTYEGLKQSEKMLHAIAIEARDKSKYLNWVIKNIERLEYINEIRTDIISWLEKDILDVLNFHKKENDLIALAQNNETSIQENKAVCQFYFEHGITSLATKYLLKIGDISTDADLQYIKGCSSSICDDQEQADQCFKKAIFLNQEIKTKIDSFKMEQAKEYYQFGEKWKTIDRGTSKNLFLKGLYFEKSHPGILKELEQLINEDLESLSVFFKENNYMEAKKIINQWIKDIDKKALLKESIDNKQIASLYTYAGKISVHEENYELAYNQYLKAAKFDPNNPESYILVTDLCFTVEDYDKGVAALNVAVQLDRSNAKYWEIIGDNMLKFENFNDALSAYEKCFLEMPEKIHLLKKIGDIYITTGRLEAAHEAYKQYEKLIKASHPTS